MNASAPPPPRPPMKQNPIPALLVVGTAFVIGGTALLGAKLALISTGLVCLVTAWTLIRAGRF